MYLIWLGIYLPRWWVGGTLNQIKYDLLKNKCEDKGDQQRLSECLTSLRIKEVFNCSCTPGLCVEASKRAKAYLEKADRIQNDLEITTGNSSAQCLSNLADVSRNNAIQRKAQDKRNYSHSIKRLQWWGHMQGHACSYIQRYGRWVWWLSTLVLADRVASSAAFPVTDPGEGPPYF